MVTFPESNISTNEENKPSVSGDMFWNERVYCYL